MKKVFLGFIAIFFMNCFYVNAQKVGNNDYNPQGATTGKIIIIDIARKKHSPDPKVCGDCKCGLGICRFCMFCSKGTNPTTHTLDILTDGKKEFVEIKLLEKIQSGIDYDFNIDDDIYADDDGKIYFEKGVYKFDSKIGEFGGYRLILNYK
jgi:hypothetical protein